MRKSISLPHVYPISKKSQLCSSRLAMHISKKTGLKGENSLSVVLLSPNYFKCCILFNDSFVFLLTAGYLSYPLWTEMHPQSENIYCMNFLHCAGYLRQTLF